MKKILSLLIIAFSTMLFISTSQAAGWLDGGGYKHRYECPEDWKTSPSINFFLHGSGGDRLTFEPASLLETGDVEPLFNAILGNCGFLVVPQSPPDRYYTWDYTGYYTAEAELARVIGIISLAKELFPDAEINVIGGSSGGVMAYAIASKLNRIGREDLIDNLVLLEAVSPFDVRVDGKLPAYAGIGPLVCTGPSNIVDLGGGTNDSEECNFIRAGLPNKDASFNIDSLSVYSVDDDVFPFEDKDILARTIVHFSTIGPASATALVSGTGHKIGQDGWDAVADFILP